MTVLEWDKASEHIFHTGVDRGVLFPKDEPAVAWNGLTSVDDGSDAELRSYYLDGVKFLENVIPGDFVGNLKAFTYPEEFDRILGIVPDAPGLFFHEQVPKSFNLSYRTRIGNDVEGIDYGYKIHLLYNLVAIPDTTTYSTNGETLEPSEFSWSLTGTPASTPGFRPMVHVSIDSTKATPTFLKTLEDLLYGTDESMPTWPTLGSLRVLSGELGGLYILDNGDGTWTAIDPGDDFISAIDPVTFQIDHANVTYLDPDTYTITDTIEPLP